jgi:tetratricopeptide (TPR) repeat protein
MHSQDDEDEAGKQRDEVLDELFARARAFEQAPDGGAHAVELFKAYVELDQQRGMAWFHLGDALRAVGRHREAETALRKALDLTPGRHRYAVYARIAMVLEKRASPLDAEKCYRIATAEAGCPGWMWTLRGANLLRAEAYGLAQTCLETALKSDDVVREETLLNLALMARSQGLYADARRYAEQALAVTPDYAEAKQMLASLANIETTIESAASIVAAREAGL